jgi:hypothetical protein
MMSSSIDACMSASNRACFIAFVLMFFFWFFDSGVMVVESLDWLLSFIIANVWLKPWSTTSSLNSSRLTLRSNGCF